MNTTSCGTCPRSRRPQITRLGIDLEGCDYVAALAGNPNTGKSTVFNALTGLHQHTGNWPGKTVARAEGAFAYQDRRFKLVDLPGTYSLMATSLDEEVARDFLLFGRPDVTIIVVDASRLERNLNLVLQVLEITDRAVLCLNLTDEARRRGMEIDTERLAAELGVPVVPTSARFGKGIRELIQTVHDVATGKITCRPRRVGGRTPGLQRAVQHISSQLREVFPHLSNADWVSLRLLDGDPRVAEAVRRGEFRELKDAETVLGEGGGSKPSGTPQADIPEPLRQRLESILEQADKLRWEVGMDFHQVLVEAIYAEAARIAGNVVRFRRDPSAEDWDRRLDRILTSRVYGYPIMVGLFLIVIWLTVQGANYPSALLSALLVDTLHPLLRGAALWAGVPSWIRGPLIDGGYLAMAWVVSVMLPPMAIFFPIFTLLEDFGYLPRVAFNLDRLFRWAGAHGKQALTMTMGFGCNAAGVVACRVIDSPRERLLAVVTNNFSLCNGRWPTQILLATIFLGALAPAYLAGVVATLGVIGVAMLGVLFTFLVSWALSRTVLRGEVSTFHLELPPYRPPRLFQTLYTSLIDRTLIVLGRAVMFAFPAGIVIWLLANINVADRSLAEHVIHALDPLGTAVGLNGVILLAYIIAIPANEIVIPTVLMLTVLTTNVAGVAAEAGVLFEPQDMAVTAEILRQGGWTTLTAVCLMLFSLLHNPCSTTIYTIYKETGSVKWTVLSTLLPIVLGFAVCFAVSTSAESFLPGL
ncbi:MAG: ferrous iron transport protein B [Thermogutta sp.]|nr:ferrous iron transport protein B [Thermogutta sp.]